MLSGSIKITYAFQIPLLPPPLGYMTPTFIEEILLPNSRCHHILVTFVFSLYIGDPCRLLFNSYLVNVIHLVPITDRKAADGLEETATMLVTVASVTSATSSPFELSPGDSDGDYHGWGTIPVTPLRRRSWSLLTVWNCCLNLELTKKSRESVHRLRALARKIGQIVRSTSMIVDVERVLGKVRFALLQDDNSLCK